MDIVAVGKGIPSFPEAKSKKGNVIQFLILIIKMWMYYQFLKEDSFSHVFHREHIEWTHILDNSFAGIRYEFHEHGFFGEKELSCDEWSHVVF